METTSLVSIVDRYRTTGDLIVFFQGSEAFRQEFVILRELGGGFPADEVGIPQTFLSFDPRGKFGDTSDAGFGVLQGLGGDDFTTPYAKIVRCGQKRIDPSDFTEEEIAERAEFRATIAEFIQETTVQIDAYAEECGFRNFWLTEKESLTWVSELPVPESSLGFGLIIWPAGELTLYVEGDRGRNVNVGDDLPRLIDAIRSGFFDQLQAA